MRAELLSIEQLKRFARELAERHETDFGPGTNRLLPRLAENTRALREAHDVLVEAQTSGRRMTPPAEWLLDNFYMIEQQIHLARQHLPSTYSRLLPRLTQGPMKGLPRIYALASDLIAHLDGQLDAETSTAFLQAYQTAQPLLLGELWAFPIALRLGLIENLRRVAVRIADRRRDKESGIRWAERMLSAAEMGSKQVIHLLAEFADAHPRLSAPFLEEFTSRLQGQGPSLTFVSNWLEQALAEESTNTTQRLHADGHVQAAEHLSISNSIASLRFLGAMDWKKFVEELSHVERILRRDPSGAHADQDFATRDRYRHVIEELAKRAGKTETEVAQATLELAVRAAARSRADRRTHHVGYYLVGNGRRDLRRAIRCRWCFKHVCANVGRRTRVGVYLGAIGLFAMATAMAPAWLSGVTPVQGPFWLWTLLCLVPASSLALSLMNFLVTVKMPPQPLARLDFSDGIPPECLTMVAVPTLLPNRRALARMLEALEIRYLGNRDPQLRFALLTDFPDAKRETLPGDAALLDLAQAGIEHLNRRYPRQDGSTSFYLFHRPRVWNAVDQCWMGFERKRGKLEQFNDLLRGNSRKNFARIVGDLKVLRKVRYVITLDTDTDLPRGAGHRMVGAMAHPLNRPRIDTVCRRVVEGYAILQPRTSVRPTVAERSRFMQFQGCEPGLDPYAREVSDVYQDLFGEGSFVGKGIYDVDAFRAVLAGRLPQNRILSHDLLECTYARSALLGCVELFEDAPSTYFGEISRRHRWMRGDWQIVQWLWRRVPSRAGTSEKNPLSLLSQWKIFDNVRRALFAPTLLGLLIGGWLWGPRPSCVWTLFALAVLGLTGLLRSLTLVASKPRERGLRLHLRTCSLAMLRQLVVPVFELALLPYETFIALDAMRLSVFRMPFSQRGLMLWHLDQYRRRNLRRRLSEHLREMWFAPVLGMGVAKLALTIHPGVWTATLPVALLWLLSPLAAWWISRPLKRVAPTIAPERLRLLRKIARRTWHYFDTFVGADDHWLPPDNFQEEPEPMVASRTSPTNMGFGLLANLSAWDFGYLSTASLLERTTRTMDALDKLERYRGHFYNWYDTRTLRPLPPLYISSVDSGNLATALLTLRNGLSELRDSPAVPPQVWEGLRDTVNVIADEAGSDVSPEFMEALREVELRLVAPPENTSASRERLRQLVRASERLRRRVPDAESFQTLARWAETFESQCRDHDLSSHAWAADDDPLSSPTMAETAGRERGVAEPDSRHRATELLQRIELLIERTVEMQAAMDFRFLMNPGRKLLSIGFDVIARRLDPSCYDLLASEARTTSFLLVADDQAPPEHWFALGRLLTDGPGGAVLLSWSGSMFEYLMPALFMEHHPNTLLGRTCRGVIDRQIRYGRRRRIPWGISESCYHATDAQRVYQYRAFGVPGLGLKRGLAEDLVVAPYATLLALPFAPNEACANLERLIEQEEALGEYGMVEAIDYTPDRVPRGKQRAVVRSYMSHHQGMGLLAMSHVLHKGAMQRRFMSDPVVRATEMLLRERIPDVSAALRPHERESQQVAPVPIDTEAPMRIVTDPHNAVPEVHLLSNGRYHVMVTQSGGGYSRWRDLAVTRWREDATRDHWGSFVYLRDVNDGVVWSSAFHPTARTPEHYEAVFTQGRAEFKRRDSQIETHTEICVSPEDDVEIRRIKLSNQMQGRRRIELTSYAEMVLAPRNADLAHRVFNNLFVRTEILPEAQAILCSRRKREASEEDIWVFHLMIVPGRHGDVSYETDRERFLGRGRTTRNPLAMDTPKGTIAKLSNTAGAVLDPIAAIRSVIDVDVDEPAVAHYVTGAAATREQALALIDKYRDSHFVDRAFDMAWSHSQIVLRLLNVSESETQLYGRLAGSVLFSTPRNRASSNILVRNRLGQEGLWRFGISGDLPIVLLRIGNIRRMDLVQEALRAHGYWRIKGLQSDLVILNEDFSGYRATLNDRIVAAIHACPETGLQDRPGGVFVRRIENLSEEDLILFQSVARVLLTDSAETLSEQIERRLVPRRLPPLLEVPETEPSEVKPAARPERERLFVNGPGGFTPDGREYVIMLTPGEQTPAPWANVIASPHAGTIVTESGGGYTWGENAHEFRLTTWHNDPVSDPVSEALYLRDEDSGRYWSLTPRPAPGRNGYVCRHGFGYTVFDYEEDGIAAETWIYVSIDAPVKFAFVKLRNHSTRARRISLTSYHELVLGEWRHSNLPHINTEVDSQSDALLARNYFNRMFHDRVVFATCSEPDAILSGNRMEFIGRNGSLAAPDALQRVRLSGRTGAGMDPAAILQTVLELGAGQEREVVFTLGAVRDVDTVRELRQRYGGTAGARTALEGVWDYWNRSLGALHVEKPGDPAFMMLANGWLLYQTLSCRIWGRSGFYQSGGAYGFRDQLQDSLALLHAAPQIVREHILLCAGRQFVEGDVQHWWHPPDGAGVRTRFSDDLLWLPLVVTRYLEFTGDETLLDESAPFLEGRALADGEESQYDQHAHAGASEPVYEHCRRAIRRSLRFGRHGLPLIGCGDWNDGLNRVGIGGQGESVWLAWFLCHTLKRFEPVARNRGDLEFADLCLHERKALQARIEAEAWDGQWYRRAYFDDGTPLGSASNDECRIDAISQSWAVIGGAGRRDRSARALRAVRKQLVRDEDRLILLFTPPFDKTEHDPGYIKGYPPGVRENGGQYTHAAIWTVMAFALQGDVQTAWELFEMLNPIRHGDSPEAIARYRVEPYVMTADLYGAAPHTGRGGWSWYTGAAGWMYQLMTETLLGLERTRDFLRVHPRLPDEAWHNLVLHYRFREQVYHVTVIKVAKGNPSKVVMDGEKLPDDRIPLLDDQRDHQVSVHVPGLH